jgi:Secretion system C-terminal sorting domain
MKKTFIFLIFSVVAFGKNALPPVLPAPTDFVNTYQGAYRLDWSWTDNASNEDGYYLQRKLPADANFSTIATLPANSTGYSDCGISPNTAYQYKIVAYLGGTTAESYVYNIATKTVANGEPIAPNNLTLTMLSYNNLRLNWSDNSGNETAFYLYSKAPNASDFSFLTAISANTTSTNLSISLGNALYQYKISAINAKGESCFSNVVTVSPFVPATPNAPSNLIVTGVVGKAVSMKWNDNSNNETYFVLERSIDNYSYFQIGTNFPANATTYTIDENPLNHLFYYRVKACFDASCSAYSNVAIATDSQSPPPPAPPVVTPCSAPAAPSNLAISNFTNKTISMIWSDNSGNETHFIIERSVDDYSYFNVSNNLPANTTSFTSTELFSGLKYYYRAKACNGTCCSAYSNVSNATTQSTPVYIPPTGRIAADEAIESIVSPKIENLSLKVFPNPADDIIQVQLPDDMKNQAVNLQLFNSKGQIFWSKSIENYVGENIEISTTNYQSGLYFLSAKTKSNKISQKISLQH